MPPLPNLLPRRPLRPAPRYHIAAAFCLLVALYSPVSGEIPDRVEVVPLPVVGESIDRTERDYFGLFPHVDDFRSARFLEIDGRLMIELRTGLPRSIETLKLEPTNRYVVESVSNHINRASERETKNVLSDRKQTFSFFCSPVWRVSLVGADRFSYNSQWEKTGRGGTIGFIDFLSDKHYMEIKLSYERRITRFGGGWISKERYKLRIVPVQLTFGRLLPLSDSSFFGVDAGLYSKRFRLDYHSESNYETRSGSKDKMVFSGSQQGFSLGMMYIKFIKSFYVAGGLELHTGVKQISTDTGQPPNDANYFLFRLRLGYSWPGSPG